MPLTLDQITEEAIKLPLEARAELADKLVQGFESEDADEIQRLWSAEAIAVATRFGRGRCSHFPASR